MSLKRAFLTAALLTTACSLVFARARVAIPHGEPEPEEVVERPVQPEPEEVAPVETPTPVVVDRPEPEPAQDEPTVRLMPEEILPEDTFAFVSVESMDGIMKSLGKLKLAGLLDEPLVGKRLRGFITSFEEAFEPGKADARSFTGMLGIAGLKPSTLGAVFPGRVAVAARNGRKGNTNIYFVADITGKRERVKEMVDEFMAQVESKRQDIVTQATLYRNMGLRTFELPDNTVYGYTYIANLLVIGYGREAIEEVIDQRLDAAMRVLRGNPTFRKLQGELAETASAFYYVDVRALLEDLRKSGRLGTVLGLGAQAEKIEKVTGNTGYVAGASYPYEGGVRDRIVVTPTDPTKPLFSSGFGKEIRQKTSAFAPLDSLLFSVSYLDAAKWYRNYLEDMQQAQPEMARQTRNFVRMLEEKIKLSFEDEILPVFKGEMAVIATQVAGEHYPHLVMVLETNDPARAAELLELLQEKLRGSLSRTSAGRANVYYYVSPDGSRQGTGFEPAVAMVDDSFVVVGSSVNAVQKVVRQRRFAVSSITQSPSYVLATQDLPRNVTSLFFLDVPRLVEVVYNFAALVVSSMQASGQGMTPGGIDLSAWPAPESLASHMVPLAVSMRMSEGRVYVDIFSPIGFLAAPLGAAAYFSRDIGEIVEEKMQDELAEKLRKIGVGLHLYAADFDRFPLVLSELFPTYVGTDISVFMAPSGKRQVFTKEDIDTHSDFVYVPGVRTTDLSETIIVYTKPYVHKGEGRTVLFLAPVPQMDESGNVVRSPVRRMTESEFRAKMEKQGRKVR